MICYRDDFAHCTAETWWWRSHERANVLNKVDSECVFETQRYRFRSMPYPFHSLPFIVSWCRNPERKKKATVCHELAKHAKTRFKLTYQGRPLSEHSRPFIFVPWVLKNTVWSRPCPLRHPLKKKKIERKNPVESCGETSRFLTHMKMKQSWLYHMSLYWIRQSVCKSLSENVIFFLLLSFFFFFLSSDVPVHKCKESLSCWPLYILCHVLNYFRGKYIWNMNPNNINK